MDIWGGKLGTELLSRMNFAHCVEGVIDNGLSADSHCGKKVISVIEFMDLHNDNIIVVVCADRHNETFMMNQMRQIGLEFTAQNKRKKRFDISKMKHSLDLAFRAIDFMELLNIAGGAGPLWTISHLCGNIWTAGRNRGPRE